MDQQPSDSVRRFRSPPYPAISLDKAVERARELYAKAMHHPVGINTLAESWGYTAKSSGLWATAAALIQYGLMRDEGSAEKRKFQLLDSAVRIIRDADPASPKRREALKRAAMNPAIYQELWGRFQKAEGVSESVLINYLTLDRSDEGKAPFSDSAAADVVRGYKEAMTYVTGEPPAILSHSEAEKGDPSDLFATSKEVDPPSPQEVESTLEPRRKVRLTKAGMKEDVFTLKEGDVVIQWPERLSPDSFADFEAWTTLMLRKIKREAVDAPEPRRRTTAELLGDDEGE